MRGQGVAMRTTIAAALLMLAGCADNRIVFPAECEPIEHECSAYGCDYIIHCPWRFTP